MGRAKLNMELITNEKTRNTTFKKRKQGLIRKIHEFTTLCDVSACMIVYGPKQEPGSNPEPEIWPQSPEDVRRIIDMYRTAKDKDSGHKTSGLSEFFQDRERRIEDELAKLKKKNMEAKYPTRPEFMNYMTEASLRDFAAGLSSKADYVKSRIELLRRTKQGGGGGGGGMAVDVGLMDYYYNVNHQLMHNVSNIVQYPTNNMIEDDRKYQELVHSVNQQNSMMKLLMSDTYSSNDQCMQYGVGPSGGYGPRPVLYESTGMVNMWDGTGQFGQYYGPMATGPVPGPPQAPFVQMGPTPPLQFPKWENNEEGGDQEGQYQMNFDNIGRYYE